MLSSLITFDRIVKLEADTFLSGPLRVLDACRGVSVPHTRTHPQSFISWTGIKAGMLFSSVHFHVS